jgi:hypothetical protein
MSSARSNPTSSFRSVRRSWTHIATAAQSAREGKDPLAASSDAPDRTAEDLDRHINRQRSGVNPQQFQQSLVKVVGRARGIDVRHYEWREHGAVEYELLPAIAQSLSETIELMARVVGYYRPAGLEVPDGTPANEPGDVAGERVQRIVDLAYMARWELHREHENLAQLPIGKEAWTVISECDRACRRLITSAIAVEDALCAHEGLTRTLHALYHRELSRSLQVRQAYAVFRHTIMANSLSTEEHVRDHLRRAAIGIAQLVGSGIYGDLRASDRMRIEAIRGRLNEWLGGHRENDTLNGQRLWQDIRNIAELLLEVNKRAELREHDQAVAAEAYTRLFHGDRPPQHIPQDLENRLRSLFGRDEDLDRLIADPASHPITEWQQPLQRVLDPPGTAL